MKKEKVSQILKAHYKETFTKHGPCAMGVDWGNKENDAILRHEKMLNVLRNKEKASILDVGCGYGALAEIIKKKKISLDYTGIDIVNEMVMQGKKNHPEYIFYNEDVMSCELKKYDYVVCNGILTQKLNVSTLSMNQYAQKLIKRLFNLSKVGVAFNLMTTYVNFQNENLYYRNPSELLGWCMSELTPHVKLDAAYSLWYEYTIYLYRESE